MMVAMVTGIFMDTKYALAVVLLISIPVAIAQCTSTLQPSGDIQTSVASGFAVAVVATGLATPRSLEFDSAGNLLVLEQGKGLSRHSLDDGGGTCVSVMESKDLIEDEDVGSF